MQLSLLGAITMRNASASDGPIAEGQSFDPLAIRRGPRQFSEFGWVSANSAICASKAAPSGRSIW